jgi:hypothetical protein
MKMVHRIVTAAALAAAAAGAQAAGIVEVTFPHHDPYTDAGRTAMEISRTEQALAGDFKQMAGRLADGQTLRVEVLDIDLAGEVALRRGGEVRIARGRADWPRITLRYRLEGGGQLLQGGEETVADMSYLNSLPRKDNGADLPHEKHMLDEWFRERFAHPQPQ